MKNFNEIQLTKIRILKKDKNIFGKGQQRFLLSGKTAFVIVKMINAKKIRWARNKGKSEKVK